MAPVPGTDSDNAELIAALAERLSEHRVLGEPIERDGVTVVPVVEVFGAGGIGGRRNPASRGNGGFGMVARPVGAWVIRDGNVTWQPAFDLNRVILVGNITGIVSMLVLWSLIRRLRGRR